MIMNIKYFFGAVITIPLLPVMYYQSKQIMNNVPTLPEAKGAEGECHLITRTNNNKLKIISIGESTIAGVGVETHSEGFTGTFANEISRLFVSNVTWKVYARNGYTAKRVVHKLIPEITEKEADLIIIGLGANDAFTLNRPSKWKNEISTLIESLKSKFPKAILIFLNMPPIKEFPAFTPLIKFTIGNLVAILGEELEKLVNNYENVFYFGEQITLKTWINKFGLNKGIADFFSDGVHPSKLTYQIWAKDIAMKVSQNTEIKEALQLQI